MAENVMARAVIFDLDGTLVATDRFWPDAARAGALRAFLDLGWDRPVPEESVWMGMVGQPLEEAFLVAFPEMGEADRKHLFDCCVEEEHRLLDEGRAGLLPGVEETLAWLVAQNIPIGVASNCSASYLDAILGGLGVGRWVREARCLDSPGIANKAEMIGDLLLTFDTRHAVMVGDRAGDRDAAWANGIPHVHLSRGYAQRGESVQAEATIPGLDCFSDVLDQRRAAVAQLIQCLEVPGNGATIGVLGRRCSGVRDFARDLAAGLAAQGRGVEFIDGYQWLRNPDEVPGLDAGDPLVAASEALDLNQADLALAQRPTGDRLRVVALPLGLHPSLLSHLERVIWTDGAQDVLERRLRGEFFTLGGPRKCEWVRDQIWPLEAALVRAFPPALLAHLTVDLSNALKPLVALAPGPG